MPDLSGLPVTGGQQRGDMDVVRIGRLPDNDIVVDDLGVARHQAELRRSHSGQYEIIDLASFNGTYVNGELREHDDEGNDTPGT